MATAPQIPSDKKSKKLKDDDAEKVDNTEPEDVIAETVSKQSPDFARQFKEAFRRKRTTNQESHYFCGKCALCIERFHDTHMRLGEDIIYGDKATKYHWHPDCRSATSPGIDAKIEDENTLAELHLHRKTIIRFWRRNFKLPIVSQKQQTRSQPPTDGLRIDRSVSKAQAELTVDTMEFKLSKTTLSTPHDEANLEAPKHEDSKIEGKVKENVVSSVQIATTDAVVPANGGGMLSGHSREAKKIDTVELKDNTTSTPDIPDIRREKYVNRDDECDSEDSKDDDDDTFDRDGEYDDYDDFIKYPVVDDEEGDHVNVDISVTTDSSGVKPRTLHHDK